MFSRKAGSKAKRFFLPSLALLLLCTAALAIEYDPIQFLTKQTYMLRENESASKFIIIKHEAQPYYVVQITANGEVAGYIALERYNKKVVEDKIKSKLLFQTAEFISRYTEFKKNVNENPSYVWFILKYNDIPTIEQKLENEKLELKLIAQTVTTYEASSQVATLSSMLDVLIAELEELHKKMLDAVSFESSFLKEPETGKESELKDMLLSCYELLASIYSHKQEYESALVQLKIEIANDPNLDRETKKQLNETADLPEEAMEIDKWYTSATNMQFKENLETIAIDSSDKSTRYSELISLRLKRDLCYRFIYEENKELERRTDKKFTTLKEAYDAITDEKNRDKWKNQMELAELESNWKKMMMELKKEDYDSALDHAKKALHNVIRVYEDGFYQSEDSTRINYQLLIQATVAIIIILGIIYALRNRKKLISLVSGEEYEEIGFERL